MTDILSNGILSNSVEQETLDDEGVIFRSVEIFDRKCTSMTAEKTRTKTIVVQENGLRFPLPVATKQ